jgi:hypothetical protein
VRLLRSDLTVRGQQSDGYLTVTVPSVLDLEVVAVDW